ncbi:MAG: ATP-dependent Lon protease [Pseudoalteromonas tetraodonis]|jgi:ATP-dependent Lon protease|uniref:Lon protease n=6 Tax=Gammaproteobacteria TaxID=1236 RepID=A0AA37S146_9GAMM|nr:MULTISPECIES: endopeptidase La [Pseudoalteromonas]PHQ93785.1 MAG: endopeptidase La [Pseudoalteromonas sp.]ADT69039.1 DNA-binding ATP-dependent protease La; heat shock K-protein [Pseudoalteromonas sp. SM9913]ALQ55359.1 Lon protease [Pseudoalteromonas issachenkonii]ATC91204.1 ATP-dependent Lon protease [Pseudoalteromonas issachenkonii]ATD03741.1 ATP-dependent Lon protease [Pseudoalteromonas tetraodonis]|tara:strand:+ start:3569 stop:5929 length:2361 start_codon:yes stop_codon:yes gene_type:complete
MTLERNDRVEIPVLALRDVVVYPHMVIPLFVGREKSIKCLEAAMDKDKQIFLVAQKDATVDEPEKDDIYRVGTIATVLQLLKLPDGTVKVLVEGTQRANIEEFVDNEDFFVANAQFIESDSVNEQEQDIFIRSALSQFEGYVKLNKKIPPEVMTSVSGIDEPARLADTMAAHMPLKVPEKQKVLEISSVTERLEYLMALMEGEIDLLQVEKKIRTRVKKQMEKSQREYYLNEQMKAIQKELGEIDDVPDEFEALKKRIEESGMPSEAKEKATAELNKLKMMSPMSAEASVVRSYIDTLINVPWKKRSKVKKDLAGAQKILDSDHHGLDKVKERIIEYLAVQQRTNKLKGPILCLVGPPGVGKTSLGQSIARSTGRKYVRMALGGVRDEAEIRGHRRTYIGSMPGKLIQNMTKVGVKNPLFLLDEIDKMSADMRGDPASALLEVLDPEQNSHFADHYLEVDYDLSDVMFVATSNSFNIPGPLLDRMEVIRLSGYTEDEKLNIAKEHLIPKQIKRNGLKAKEVEIADSAIIGIIRYYTREAGVRNLEREVSKLCRKAVKNILIEKDTKTVTIDADNLEEYLGVQRFDYGKAEDGDRIGQVTGLAWTEVGGDLLTIECAAVPGKGKLTYTGSLGDVMQESIQAAMTVVRNRADELRINSDFYEKRDIHVHVPEGATPKDGPSAGIAMVTCLVSSLTGNAVRSDVAMTGEITLRGEVLPIGGLKEKLLAAHRGGIKTVIIPKINERDLKEIPDNVLAGLDIHPVTWIDEVLKLALVHPVDSFSVETPKKQ